MSLSKKRLAVLTLSSTLALTIFAQSDNLIQAAETVPPVEIAVADTVTVTFDPNGGTIDQSKQTVEVESGTVVDLPYTWQIGLANPGYSFTGWTVQETGEAIGKYENYTPAQDVTLVAQWEVTKGKVQFYDHSFQISGITLTAADGTIYEMSSTSRTNNYRKWEAEDVPNGSYTVKFTGLTEGAIVDAEITTHHSSFVQIADGAEVMEATFTFEDDKVTTFARAEFHAFYPVTFDAGKRGALPEEGQIRVEAGEAISEVPTVETKKNFVFLGWSLDGETVIDPATVLITEPTTLHAIYGKTNQGNGQIKMDIPGNPNQWLNSEG